MLKVENTVKSYAGKLGCMCGCLGNYSTTERARKRAITDILKLGAQVQDFKRVDKDGIAGCMFAETETRNRVVYLTEQGLIKARAMGIKEAE